MNELEEILGNKENYVATEMEKFSVDNEEYTDYSDYTFAWELTYNKTPERAQNGSMGDLDTNYSAFLTPHMTVTYDIMTISDYRRIMKQFYSKRQFMVKCYDPVYDTIIEKQMYFATPNAPKFYYLPITGTNGEKEVSLLGVKDYTVELIGTNNDDNN